MGLTASLHANEDDQIFHGGHFTIAGCQDGGYNECAGARRSPVQVPGRRLRQPGALGQRFKTSSIRSSGAPDLIVTIAPA